jgi:uncharacterized protein (UPF0335 family)
MSDIAERAKAAHARRWEQPGGVYPQTVPSAVVELGDWASEELPELVAEVERLQHELRDAARRIKAFAKDCATHGDMTPMAKIQWNKLADTIAKVEP